MQETAAHKIADALPSVLGPAAHYDVQVDGDPFALARGRARGVHIQGQDVQLSPTITLDTLNADAADVSFDTNTRRLSHVGATQFTATMDQAHLTAYLAQSKPLLPGLVVTLRPSDVEARVPVTFLGLHTTAALSGTFAPDAAEPSRLDFVTTRCPDRPCSRSRRAWSIWRWTRSTRSSVFTGLKAPLTILRRRRRKWSLDITRNGRFEWFSSRINGNDEATKRRRQSAMGNIVIHHRGGLVVLWLIGFLMHIGGGLIIHILLVIAVIVFLYQFLTGRRSV